MEFRAHKNGGPLRGEIMTVHEVAAYLRVHYSTIYRLCRNGAFPGFRLGTSWRFQRSEIDRWVKAREGRR